MNALILSYALDTNGQNARFVKAAQKHGADVLNVLAMGKADPAGVVSRMLVMPTGALAETTALERALGSAAALGAYYWLTRRNLLVGVAAGAAALWLLKL